MPEPEETEIPASDLNPEQSKAIAALLEEPTIKQAAAAVGVNEATLWRWLQTPAFRKAYAQARRKAVQQAMARIQHFTSEAASVLSGTNTIPLAPTDGPSRPSRNSGTPSWKDSTSAIDRIPPRS